MDGFLLTLNWLFDSGMNFMPHLLLALLIGLGVAVRVNSTPWMIALATAAGIAWGGLAVSSFNHAPAGAAPQTANTTVFKTLTFNLYNRNRNHEKVIDYIWQAEADAVCLQEALGDWHTAVSSLLRLYPHALQSAKGGTILLSKYPLKILDVNLAQATPYSIAVTVEGLGRPVDLVCVHLTRAASPSKMALRNQELGYLARTIFKSEHPVILMGDFNASTRSPALFRFMQQAGVRTADPGFPPANSWPASFPLVGMRIDHVMFSPPFRLIRNKVGPALGSNHRPVTTDLILPKDTAPAPEKAPAKAG